MKSAHVFKQLFRSTSVYITANILNSALPFFLMPVLTRYLQPADYGLIVMYQMISAISVPVIGMSIYGAIARRYFDKDEIQFDVYVGNAILLVVMNSLIVFLLALILQKQASKISGIPEGWILSIILYSFCSTLISVGLNIYQVESKPFKYSCLQFGQLLLQFSITILLVVFFKYNWQGRLLGIIIPSIVCSAIVCFLLFNNHFISFKFNRSYVINILSFGVPLIPHALGGLFLSQVDRYFMSKYIGVAEVGIYSVALQLCSVFTVIQQSFNNAYFPWLYKQLKENDPQQQLKIVLFTYLYFVVLAIGAVALYFSILYLAPIFVGEKFAASLKYVGWLSGSVFFQCAYYLVAIYIAYAEKTSILAFVTVFCGIITVILNLVLINANGSVGVAQASCIANGIMFIMTWWLSSRVWKMPWLFFIQKLNMGEK